MKQKPSAKKQENQQEYKKHHKSNDKLKSRNAQASKSSTRKGHTGHDPPPAQIAHQKQRQAEPNVPPMNCFSADTKVYTQNGEKTMKEISVGDFVNSSLPIKNAQLIEISLRLLEYFLHLLLSVIKIVFYRFLYR